MSRSYYAYVNNHMCFDWGSLGEHSGNTFSIWDMNDVHLHMHPEHGLSMHDNHSDASGAAYASRLRPFMHMGPRAHLWQYNADTHITDWLEEKGIQFDVITSWMPSRSMRRDYSSSWLTTPANQSFQASHRGRNRRAVPQGFAPCCRTAPHSQPPSRSSSK